MSDFPLPVRFDRAIVRGLRRTVETARHVQAETGRQIELEVLRHRPRS